MPVYVATEGYMKEGGVIDCSVDEGYTIHLPAKLILDGMALDWRGTEGHFFNAKGTLVAFDPSVRQAGPGALLIRKDQFIQFLHDNDYEVLWTVLGEKNDYRGSPQQWKGRLEISGAYKLINRTVKGSLNTTFRTGSSTDPQSE